MILRRDFIKTAAAGALSAGRSFSAPAKRAPNIIVILADDMGFSDLGCYGSEIRTPHIDGLARGGVRFTHFRNTARCCPSRASLLTGLYAHQAGMGHMVNPRPSLPGYVGDLNRNCVTIAQVLRGSGYQTMMTGKWHVTPPPPNDKHNWPLQRGFDRYFGIIAGSSSYYQPVTLTRDNEPIEPEGRDFYLTDAIGRNAAAYIESAKKDRPFFLYTAFTSPHWPLHAFENDIARHKGRYKDGWDALRAERHERMMRMGIVERRWGITPRDSEVPAWKDEADKEWQQRRMEVYAAQIDRMDQNIGRMMEALRRSGQEENTLVLLLADNGGCAEDLPPGRFTYSMPKQTRDGRPLRPGNMPSIMPGAPDTFGSYGIAWANASNTPFRRYKHWVHEGGVASPLIARWPKGIARHNAIVHEPGHLVDLMATCVDVAGAKYPESQDGERILPMEGRSLAPAFGGRKVERSDAFYWEHEGNRAVAEGKWKLVSRFPNRWELYDLEADRCEMHDLATTDTARAERMAGMYDRWAARCNVRPWSEVQKVRAEGS